ALETTGSQEVTRWTNPTNGRTGTISPLRTFKSTAGLWCREYRETVVIDGQQGEWPGVACRDMDGTWQPVWIAALESQKAIQRRPEVEERRSPRLLGWTLCAPSLLKQIAK